MTQKLKEFDEARMRIARLQGELDLLRNHVANELGNDELPEENFHTLVFRVGEDRLAIPLALVEEVLMVAETSAIPEAPPWISGLLDLRGEALVVLDVAARLQRQAREPEVSDMVVICLLEGSHFGLVVQEILDIVEIGREDLRQAAPEKEQAPYVTGVFPVGEGLVQLVGLRSLLTLSDLPEIET